MVVDGLHGGSGGDGGSGGGGGIGGTLKVPRHHRRRLYCHAALHWNPFLLGDHSGHVKAEFLWLGA